MKNIIKKSKSDKESYIKKKVLFADFETVIVDSFHYVSVYDLYDGEKHVCKSLENVKSNDLFALSRGLVLSFVEDCFVFAANSIIYFHNFGRFDALFLLRNLDVSKYKVNIKMRDNIYYEVSILYGKKKVVFRDSYLLFPSSLNDMSALFLNEKKKEFSHLYVISDYSNPVMVRDIKEYCKHDTYLLCESFGKYRKYVYNLFNLDICRTLSLSSLSLKIFLSRYYDDSITPITHIEGNIDSFIRRSYRGGVVDVYKPVLEDGFCYDVNSLYPYVMGKYLMPSTFIKHTRSDVAVEGFDINNFFGFVEVDVCCTDLEMPFLTYYKKDVGLISPLGQWRGVYFSEEIKYALSLGYSFKYYSSVSFKSDILFKDFVDSLYEIRCSNKGTPLDKILKFLLNSLYGRFGMMNEVRKCLLLDSNESKDYINRLLVLYDVKLLENIDENKTLLKFVNKPVYENIQYIEDISDVDKALSTYENAIQNMRTAVHISSAITAYGRIEMHKYKRKYNVYYSDTDSLFVDHKIDDAGDKLGQLKLEYPVKYGIFIAPKLYYIDKGDGSYVFKGKGINAKELNKEDYMKMYRGYSITVNVIRNFVGNIVTLLLKRVNTTVRVSGMSSKRHKVFNNNGNWIDTHPYYIDEFYDEEI